MRDLNRRVSKNGVLANAVAVLLLSLALQSEAVADHNTTNEPYNSGWSLQVDNDLFAATNEDQNYTGGFAVTLSGRRALEYALTPEKLRSAAGSWLGLNSYLQNQRHHSVHALEWGAALFTPSDISRRTVNPEDRPYASLFFLNSTEQVILPAKKMSVKSSFTVGLLGLDLAETLQRSFHGAIGSEKPEGWRHQISSGGELTAKYGLSMQRALYQQAYASGLAQELNWTAKGDLGFTTGIGVGVNWRFGRINTPWWSFNPHQSDYFNLGANVASGQALDSRIKERYVYAGSTINYTAYNAFTQGQFRNSAHTVDSSDVVKASAEVWGGFTTDISENIRIDVFVRARTKDVDLQESRELAWGGLTISRRL